MNNTKLDNGHVRIMQESDLGQVLSWRNHIDVRRFMYSQHEIGSEEHKRWFASASQDNQRHLLIFEQDGQPQGFVQFKQHDNGVIADWGFYLSPEAEKGTGKKLGKAALDYIFHDKLFHKVCGEALGFNEKSIKFHLGLGFRQEGILREQYFDGESYHDIYSFGLLSREWHQ